MAAKYIYRNGFLLLLFNFISTAALEKRFSDLKRCADEDCSMLLVRGKAVNDFQGPDCRFLSFKKSETIYVYYKLAGRRADMWAGSVGSNFGYFPKDLLAINHIYTDKEFEVPAEETDFVCFETGFDKFQSYDIDQLLGFVKNNIDVINITSGHIKEAIQTDTKSSVEQVSEDDIIVPDEESASLFEPEIDTKLPSIGSETETDTIIQDSENEPITTPELSENVLPDVNEMEEVSLEQEEEETLPQDIFEPDPQVSPSENLQIPEIKTSYGTTFDAIVTEETTTAHTTPQEETTEEESETQQDETEPHIEPLPLLTFAEDNVQSMDTMVEKEQDMQKQDYKQKDSMWSSLGNAVFSVVTGGDKPTHDVDVNSDEDDEEEEPTPPPKTFEEIKADKQPLDIKYREPVEPPSLISKPEAASHESSEPDMLILDEDSDGDVVGPEETDVKTVGQTTEDGQQIEVVHSSEPVIQDEANENVQIRTATLENKMNEPTEDKEKLASESNVKKKFLQERSHVVQQEQHLEENNKLEIAEAKSNAEISTVGEMSDFDIKDDEETTTEEQALDQKLDNEENLSHAEIAVLMEDISEEIVQHLPEVEEVKKEELLEDENALSFSQLDTDTAQTESPNVPETPTPEHSDSSENGESTATHEDSHSDILSSETVPPMSTPEPEIVYSEDVTRLTILRDYLTEDKIVRCQKYLGLKNLFKLEAMFEDLDTELQATRQSQIGSAKDIENSLQRILEASENAILDQVEKILDSRESKYREDVQHIDTNIDEETEILDDFQEIAFILRHKYSTISDSVPLAEVKEEEDQDEHDLNVKEDVPLVVEDLDTENYTEPKTDHNLSATQLEQDEPAADVKKERIILDQVHAAPDVSVEEDSGHFNKNKDNQQSFGQADDLPKIPQATLENPLDMGVGVELENSGSGTLESIEPPSEFHEQEVGLFSTVLVYLDCTFSVIKTKTSAWATVMISLLPDEWRPGETLFGCPWQAVVVTALVGIVTFTFFFWRTVLAVKKREYLVDHKKLDEQIESLKKEKDEALVKMTELRKQTEQLKNSQKQSVDTANTTQKRMQALETRVAEAKKQNEQMLQEKSRYMELLKEERASCQKNETRIENLEKANEKLQQSRKKIQETLTKTTVLLDEAKIREDARNVHQKSLEKDYSALKDENKSFKTMIKSWEDRHRELSDQIKIYQKSQKELEDSLVQKDHNIEVLSDLLSDLDACDLQKVDPKVCANGEISIDKTTAIKNRIKQMMDVSRVQTTLTVVEEERDRFMAKLLGEEKTRKALEAQHQELEHTISTLKSEKSHVENQFKILQQKNEIIVEMYQQKESALQQRLTKEELERRSKENMLTEVGGKATEAEEQVKVLRQRINEMEDQMKKTEEMYKEQIKEQENKTHSNWINARNAERALNQEKQEASKLREKLAVLTSQLNEKRAPLFRPNSGQFAGPRQGDSYGPSPVSGGAPSPPIMIEGPRRPPSAPVGRKIDPYGPRPPSDPHGRYAENKHMSGMEMMGPRNSSPANMDAPGIGSFIASPIRDSPGPPPGPGPHDPPLPPGGPHGRLPPPGPYRPMRPGPYPFHPSGPGLPHHGAPLPANGHPGLPMGGEFGPRASNGHAFQPRHGPIHMDPRGPPPPHFRPPPPNFGPMPPPHIRGPMGPHPHMHPDMRYPGPRASPPMDLPPGALPPGVRPPGPMPPGAPLPPGLLPVHPPHSGPYGQLPTDSLQNSPGAQSNPGPPQDAVRNAGTEP